MSTYKGCVWFIEGPVQNKHRYVDYVNALNRLCKRSSLEWEFAVGPYIPSLYTITPGEPKDMKVHGIFVIVNHPSSRPPNSSSEGSLTTDANTGHPCITNLYYNEIPDINSQEGKRLFCVLAHEISHIVLPYEGYHLLVRDGMWDYRDKHTMLKHPFWMRNMELLNCPSVITQTDDIEELKWCPLVVDLLEEGVRQPWLWNDRNMFPIFKGHVRFTGISTDHTLIFDYAGDQRNSLFKVIQLHEPRFIGIFHVYDFLKPNTDHLKIDINNPLWNHLITEAPKEDKPEPNPEEGRYLALFEQVLEQERQIEDLQLAVNRLQKSIGPVDAMLSLVNSHDEILLKIKKAFPNT